MEPPSPTYIVNLASYAGTLVLFSFVLARTARKYRQRRNKPTKWMFFTLLFHGLSLLLVVLNTLLEYVLAVYPSPWTWGFTQPGAWLHYLQYILQFACGRDAMVLMANVFLSLFYEEIFIHEKNKVSSVLLAIYKAVGLVLAAMILVGMYILDYLQFGAGITLSPEVAMVTEARTKVIMVLVHSMVMFLPLLGKSMTLHKRMMKGPAAQRDAEMLRKLACIAWMVVFFAGIFVFALLDALSEGSFTIWFYATIGSACMAAIMVHAGFVTTLTRRPPVE